MAGRSTKGSRTTSSGVREEAALIPEYRRQKQLSSEAQKILRVLEEAAEKLETLSWLPSLLPEVVGGRFSAAEQPFAEMSGQPLSRALARVHRAEQALTTRLRRQDDDDEEASAAQQLHALRQQMRDGVRDVLRLLLDNPVVLRDVSMELVGRESQALLHLAEALRHLRRCGRQRLQELPEEKSRRQRMLFEAWMQEQSHAATCQRLSQEIEEAEEDLGQQRHQQTDVMQSLESRIFVAQRISKEEVHRICMEASQNKKLLEEESAEMQAALEEEEQELKKELVHVVNLHEDQLEQLYRRKMRLEMEIGTWVRRYDQDMFEKKEEAERLKDLYEAEREEHLELQVHLMELEGQYQSIMEHRTRRAELQRLEDELMERKVRAALLIQAYWRRWHHLYGRFRRKGKKGAKGAKAKGGKGKGGAKGKGKK